MTHFRYLFNKGYNYNMTKEERAKWWGELVVEAYKVKENPKNDHDLEDAFSVIYSINLSKAARRTCEEDS